MGGGRLDQLDDEIRHALARHHRALERVAAACDFIVGLIHQPRRPHDRTVQRWRFDCFGGASEPLQVFAAQVGVELSRSGGFANEDRSGPMCVKTDCARGAILRLRDRPSLLGAAYADPYRFRPPKLCPSPSFWTEDLSVFRFMTPTNAIASGQSAL